MYPTPSILLLSFIILLPLLPAYLLFKALPSSSAQVDGPLQGLQIKLGGAFAGYFAVVLLILTTHNIWNPPPAYQVWEVTGKVVGEDGKPIEPLAAQDVELVPPMFEPHSTGIFKIKFATWPGPGGQVEYPSLRLSHLNYGEVEIPLDPDGLKEAGATFSSPAKSTLRSIRIHAVALHKLPAYNPVAPAPSSLANLPAGENQ